MTENEKCQSQCTHEMPGLPDVVQHCTLPAAHHGTHWNADTGQAWGDVDADQMSA